MSNRLQNRIGKRIRDIRISKGVSQSQLALMTSMTKSYMSEIEAGKKNLTLRTLQKIATSLGITLEDIFRGM
ncbi:helix-turn-helix domain-containing protein [Adlercreutzia muris]|jgi:transcriptional regulator with XRE-family HTH domain|uniref:Helix-turn-helix transcriptional regulator n=1 Tax=Adlercreutzia muris TaxID=1796610 RepID=A0A7C8BQ28_9ACTN|nr:helix-turn-helix transcriptional regulator [Adlercreutzia muris]MCI8305694.1 helix-turn-helix transcriptional regulator [Enterorhabdus sp.]TGY71583.1 XRE family transcriptional regulator [Enterorhabdus sp. NM05_H27]KAB1641994.1 helix-turn-helix transcriptional regulator [Adlercreutzia muris]MCI9673508.1 helix-turn-helix transcriptional regulator [Enterorhabdus sp.]MCR2028642.1 helix-turn-helix domain-containing protein [Adlercreutzia muris]